ncbi:polyketide synthase [Verminephrobacter aporrectodeae subsp. tuberculatae]|nr:polyketide synthase [Verminephrobacter aporrectodeae subsp. tuberculatae]MCW5291039.1 polyketide synthase [Verminephrobacter aporrectodeae subsp. tuberculatae]
MDQDRNTDIAIIGAAGRFPGADSVDALWQVLLSGQEPFVLLDDAQLEAAGHGELARSPRYVRQARIPAHYDCFDAAFFGYSPREAAFMDPQQRLLLECAWHVFEHAGHVPEDADGMRTTVFSSVGMNGYSALHALPQALAGNADMFDCIIGNDKDYSAARIAYKLNLGGAAVNVQTACSSSLVAVHLAVQSLLGFEVDRALVAAATLSVPAETGYLAEESGIRSPDGHCRPFDAMSNGTVFGSGVAAVLLRRLDDAIAAGDRILAVIRSSAANNDAGGRVGFTAPGLRGRWRSSARHCRWRAPMRPNLPTSNAMAPGRILGIPLRSQRWTRQYVPTARTSCHRITA